MISRKQAMAERTAASPCPCCGRNKVADWAEEAGYKVVRCVHCRLLFVDPMPQSQTVDEAVRTGTQVISGKAIDVRARRVSRKIAYYRKRLTSAIADVIAADKPVHWVDVGAGYGEFIEALAAVLPAGSRIEGVEPMTHKAEDARARGLAIQNSYLQPAQFEADFISNIDVFSHIPDYAGFLNTVVSNLRPGGQFFMETGNTAEVEHRSEVPAELGLPDHLVFAGRPQLALYFDKAGLDILSVREDRFDTATQMAKNLIKLLIGRDSNVGIPYRSGYRQLMVRAKRRD
jgi:SAM-dependent methyltransferase